MGRHPAWSPCRLSALPLLFLLGLSVVPRRELTARGATLNVGYLAPFSGEWKGGPGMEAGIKLALSDMNKDAALLPGHTLERVKKDTTCSKGKGVSDLFELLSDKARPIVGLIGPGCSGVAMPVSSTAGLFNLVTLSASAGSVSLSDTSSYPYFMRVVTSHGSYVPASNFWGKARRGGKGAGGRG